ncbi:MAG: Flp pilus assembly complex ATPase component TadA, partial [Opitutaceae bacterium]|nr:Flp pilus assembly complex ATPase component TadA [Opitutaceae bacterium]
MMYIESADVLDNVEAMDNDVDSALGPPLDFLPPPFCDAVDGPNYSNSIVSIEIHSGHRIKGKLSRFDSEAEVVSIVEASKALPTEFSFKNIKFMRLEKPYQLPLERPSNDDKTPDVLFENDSRSFQVYFKDRTELAGKTYGSRIDKSGIHFYEQQKTGRKWRYCSHLFVSRRAVENYIIGEPIGGVLVKENAISQKDLDSVLKEQQTDRSQLLGEYLLQSKMVSSEELGKVLAHQKNMPNVKLGEILTAEGLITESQLQEALQAQKQKRKNSLGEILVDKGVINRDKIQQCLAKKLGIPFVDLHKFAIEPDVINLINADMAFNHKVIPLYVYGKKVVIAIENPTDWQVIDALSGDLNRDIEPVMASAEDISWALHFYYIADDIHQTPQASKKETTDQDNSFDASIFTALEISHINEAAVLKIFRKIIEDAHRQNVTEVHIEPGAEDQKVVVRFRKDNALSVYYKFPSIYRTAFASRIKIMAHMDVSNKVTFQEGKIAYRKFGPLDMDLRVSTIPIAGGAEDIVINIACAGKYMPINALGLNTHYMHEILNSVSKNQGLFLVCGPSGSGKNTILHSILNYLNHDDRKICTAEEPLKIIQPGLRQVEVNPKTGITHNSAIRGFLKADPDIIMLSELPDQKTSALAIEASLKGHLVLLTLHNSGPCEAIERLLDMGISPHNLADALLGILSQRLVRALCTSCKKPYDAERKEIEFLAREYCGDNPSIGSISEPDQDELNGQIKKWEETLTVDGAIRLFKSPGCKDCMDTGYRGRIGIHTLLTNTPEIRRLILDRTTVEEIQSTVLASGARTHKQDGIEKILLGYTDYSQ